jgi:acyl-CoA synthetase (AMP-forming)/AMP-acid ligase II
MSDVTAQRLLERSLRVWGARTAIVHGERRTTYASLADRSARLANVLAAFGAGPDRPAATLLPNRPEFIEADVACTRAGITRLGISDRLSADECLYLLGDSGAAVLVASASLLAPVADGLPDSVRLVLVVDDDPAPETAREKTVQPYELALAAASPALSAPAAVPATPNYILYTSGTTGRPKGATHTQGGRAASTVGMLASELHLTPGSVMLHAGPLTHGSGSKIIGFLIAGGCNVILDRFTPESFGAAVTAEGATHTFLVPTMIQRLVEASDEVAAATSRLTQISFGGSPISAVAFRRAIDRFGPILTQVYGSSEAPHPITILRPCDYIDAGASDEILTSAGRAAYGVDLRLVDESEREVPDGELGELQVRSPNLMRGYWRNEAATAEVFTPDGWYRAGDLATIDEHGFVTFRDRKRDLIISGGLNIYPSEVERVIAEHPGVRDVAVVGAPDEEWGEAVVAYVVPVDGDVTAAEIIEWTRDRLAHYKKPRHVEFLERLPLGTSNKVLKRELREQLWREHGRRVG